MIATCRRFGLLALIAFFACSPATSAVAQALRERIIGTWKLASWVRTVEGVTAPAYGEGPIGITIYTQDGHFCTQVMKANRNLFATPNPLSGTPEESAAAYASHIGYCGRFEVDEQESSILHHIEVSWYPNWTGTTQKRFAKFENDRLIFTFPTMQAGKNVVGVFTYVRAK